MDFGIVSHLHSKLPHISPVLPTRSNEDLYLSARLGSVEGETLSGRWQDNTLERRFVQWFIN